MTTAELPFFVYGTLLPGERNHDLFLRGRTAFERPAVLPGALLYEGPGYPYAIEGHGTVHGTLVTAAPGLYGELLALLDTLEEYIGPDHPRNLYERVVRTVLPAPTGRKEGRKEDREQDREQGREQDRAESREQAVRAWVYLAAPSVTRTLRTGGTRLAEGRWVTGRPPPAPRTP